MDNLDLKKQIIQSKNQDVTYSTPMMKKLEFNKNSNSSEGQMF